ncbi:MAG: hypothetical protein L6282_05320 [Candidatus Methanoperedenaceae archaeon]|nr:hypothetical protein [Candidatus Methanoperedenaceae archaeon]
MKNRDYEEDNTITRENDPYNILVRLSVLTKGPLLERRKEIRKSFVLSALSLYRPESEFDVKDLKISIKKITKCELNDEDIISILNYLQKDACVEFIGELKFKLKNVITLPQFNSLTGLAWEEFLIFLKTKYADYDPYIDKDAQNLFNSILLKLLTKFAISSKLLGKQIESLPIDDFKLIIEDQVEQASLSRNLSKKYTDIMYSFLGLKSPHLLQFIFDSYSKLINLDLVLREQEMPPMDLLENIKFLLIDTSFLTALMCKTDPSHPMASAVAKQCINSNIPLYYTLMTQQEMWRFITGSKREMGSLYQSKRYGIIKSQFVSDFRKQQRLSWPEYITILDSWEQLIGNQWKIITTPKDFSTAFDEDISQYILKTLPILDSVRNEDRRQFDHNYQPHLRGEQQIKHDAFCLGVIADHRNSLEIINGKKPMGPWFLTFDNLVSALNATYFRKDDDLGLVIQPRALLNYLLIYSKIQFEKEDIETVAEAIIKFTARTPDPKLDFDEYTRLTTYKIGLGQSDIEVLKEIFLASPLRAELKRAVEFEHGEEADDIVYRIITDKTFVEVILKERRTDEKFKNLAKNYITIKEELTKEKAAREALEKSIKQNISIEVVTNVQIQNEVSTLISLLEAENAFKGGLLNKPSDISKLDKLKSWLDDTKKIIETSTAISGGIKALLPFITYLAAKFSQESPYRGNFRFNMLT